MNGWLIEPGGDGLISTTVPGQSYKKELMWDRMDSILRVNMLVQASRCPKVIQIRVTVVSSDEDVVGTVEIYREDTAPGKAG